MRSLEREKQFVWFCSFKEINIGMDRAKIYGKPERFELTVSSTAGAVFGLGAGWSLQYTRDITSFDKSMRGKIKEGMRVFVDVVPELDKYGNLVVETIYQTDADGNIVLDEDDEPVVRNIIYNTEPDYTVSEVLDTQKGEVIRYKIKKV